MKHELDELFDKELNQSVEKEFIKLINFIDTSISQSFKLEGDERAESLIKNLLNLRDYMRSELLIERTKLDIKGTVEEIFEKFIKECDLDINELETIRNKKKDALKDEQQSQESSLEKDPLALSKKEEN